MSALREAVQLLGRPVAYYSVFTEICGGNANAGIFLSQFYFWEGKQQDPEGWIFKTQASIRKETGLGRYSQESARKCLKTLGVLEEDRRGVPPKLWFLFDWDSIDALIVNLHHGVDMKKLIKNRRELQEQADQMKDEEVRTTNHIYPSRKVFEEKYSIWMNACQGIKEGDSDYKEYPYPWTKKENGQMRNLVDRFRDRIVERYKSNGTPIDKKDVTPDQIANEGLALFLDVYIEMGAQGVWNMQSFTVSSMVSHFADHINKMKLYVSEKKGNVGTVPSPNTTGRTATGINKQRTSGHQFTSDHAKTIIRVSSWGSADDS